MKNGMRNEEGEYDMSKVFMTHTDDTLINHMITLTTGKPTIEECGKDLDVDVVSEIIVVS